jgi:hypothetical protein
MMQKCTSGAQKRAWRTSSRTTLLIRPSPSPPFLAQLSNFPQSSLGERLRGVGRKQVAQRKKEQWGQNKAWRRASYNNS